MKCFSTKRDKECLKCMQDKKYDHSLKVDQEKKKKVVEVAEEVSLRVNRSYEVSGSFIREQRMAKLPAELGLSDQSTVVAVQHIKGRLTRFCDPDSKYEDIYNWIGTFYESPLYFYLKTDPINRVDPNEVVGDRDVVLFMEETTLEDYSEFLSFCDTVKNKANPMNNMSEFFAPLDDKKKKEMTKTFFNSSPNDPKKTCEVSCHDILKHLFSLYCTHYPGNELKNIAFIGEMATGDGVTREVYSVFFKDLILLKSAGLEASVSIALNSKEAESLGSVITNSFNNNNFFQSV